MALQHRIHGLLTAGSALAALGLFAPSFEASAEASAADQATAPAAAPAAEEAAPVGIEAIVVTARRRVETAQDVPVDVSAITGDEIRRQDISSLEKLASQTPDFTVGRASNGSAAQLTLRGIGSSSTSIGIEQSVAVVIDDVYYGQGRIIEEGFFDLGQLEVLKGPQALFFGKNATAGVISLTSADPGKEGEILTKVAYEFKTRQTQAEAVVSEPLSDTLGLRIAVRGSVMEGGYYRNYASNVTYSTIDVATGTTTNHIAGPAANESPGEHEFLSRATLKWTPNDQLTGTLKLSTDYNYVNNSSWNYVDYACPGGFNGLGPPFYACTGQFVTHQNNIPTDIAQYFPYARNDGELYNRYQSYAATGTLAYKTDEYSVTSVSNYQTNNNSWACDCNFQSTSNGTWATENSTWYAVSEEARVLTTFKFPVNFMLGVLGQKTSRVFDQWIMFAGVNNSAALPDDNFLATTKHSTTDGKTWAVFGQAIWDPITEVEVAGGARFTHETKDSLFGQFYNNPAVTAIFRPADAPLGLVVAHQSFNNVSPEATITWKPMHGIMFYGAYKTAYKSGGFDNSGINSGFIAANPVTYMTFNPEKARGFEIGAKTTSLDNQLQANLTYFNYKYTDLQVDFFNSSTFDFQTVSAEARTQGAELDLEYVPNWLHGLTLRSTIDYDDAKYTSFIGPCYSGETPAAGCNIPTATLPFQNLTGAPLAMAPKVAATLGGVYSMPLPTEGMHMDWSVTARYSDRYNPSAFNNPLSEIGSYVNLDASIRLYAKDGKYEFAILGKNLSNRFYVSGVVDGPSTGGGTGTAKGVPADQLGFGNLPRTVQVQATAKF